MLLGSDARSGDKFYITPAELKTHMQVIGVSGRGKSKFLEWLMLQFIENKSGFCLIDPHGSLYELMVQWLETYRLFDKRKIILFNPYEERYAFAFNPLKRTTQSISYVVDMMVLACAEVWGGEDPNDLPRLAKYLTAIFHVLVEKGLSLYEAIHLIAAKDPQIRLYLTHDIRDRQIKKLWEDINSKTTKVFDEEIGSTSNRLTRFLNSEIIQGILSQVDDTVDFKKLMDERYIFLVNLKAVDKISFLNTSLIGTLLVNGFYMNCLGRTEAEAKANPYYLVIDECGRYLTHDIPYILDEGRKFGLHLVLSYQRLQQLRSKIGDDGFFGVLDGAQTKVVFGGLGYRDARFLADDLFSGQINYQEWKKDLTKPTVIGQRRTLLRNLGHTDGTARTESQSTTQSYGVSEGKSTGRGHGRSTGASHSSSRGTGASEGASEALVFNSGDHLYEPDGVVTTTTQNTSNFQSESCGEFFSESSSEFESENYAESRTWSETRGFSEGSSQSDTHGVSEAIESVFEERPFKEYSLEEQKDKAAALLINQPTRYAIIKLPMKEAKFLQIPAVPEPYASTKRVQAAKEKKYLSTHYIKSRAQVDREVAVRHKQLEREAIKYIELQKDPQAATPDGSKETFKEPSRSKRKKI